MSIAYYDKNTPRKMCEAIDEIGDGLGMKLSRRPWNRFKATHSSWWLVPSHKQPHHCFGKYFFDWGNKEMSSIVGGFYVEKGLDEALRAVYPSKKGAVLMMKPNWAWNSFISSVEDKSFIDVVKSLVESIDGTIEFHIDGGYVDDPTLYDPLASKLQNDYYVLEVHKDCSVKQKSAIRKGMQLKSLNKANTLDKLAAILLDLGADQWMWLNVMVALRFDSPRDGGTPDGSVVWDGQRIWDDFLSHFKQWIK